MRHHWLHIAHPDATVWLDYDLPTPTLVQPHRNAFAYAIDGWLGTAKGRSYYLDVQQRLALAVAGRILESTPVPDPLSHHCPDLLYRLFQIADLLPSLGRPNTAWRSEYSLLTSRDQLFERARHDIYALKRDGILTYENSLQIVQTHAAEFGHRAPSDLRAKARAMYRWTLANYEPKTISVSGGAYSDWSSEERARYMREYRKKRGDYMTRRERAITNSEKRSRIARNRVLNFMTGLLTHEYRKKDGSWNVAKLAKEAGVSRTTVYRVIAEREEASA